MSPPKRYSQSPTVIRVANGPSRSIVSRLWTTGSCHSVHWVSDVGVHPMAANEAGDLLLHEEHRVQNSPLVSVLEKYPAWHSAHALGASASAGSWPGPQVGHVCTQDQQINTTIFDTISTRTTTDRTQQQQQQQQQQVWALQLVCVPEGIKAGSDRGP